MSTKTVVAALATISIIAVISACGSDDGVAGSGGPSMAQFNALKARVVQLENQVDANTAAIADLQAAVKKLSGGGAAADLYLTIKAPHIQEDSARSMRRVHAYGIVTQATQNPCSSLGTLTGHPNNSDPTTSNILAGVSCTGYLYTIQAATAGNQTAVGEAPHDYIKVYETSNCTGQAYLASSDAHLPVPVKLHGVVFRVPTNSGGIPTDPNGYYYAKAGTAALHSLHSMKRFTDLNKCVTVGAGGWNWVVSELYKNDPSVTGIPSGPITGPVTIAPPSSS